MLTGLQTQTFEKVVSTKLYNFEKKKFFNYICYHGLTNAAEMMGLVADQEWMDMSPVGKKMFVDNFVT